MVRASPHNSNTTTLLLLLASALSGSWAQSASGRFVSCPVGSFTSGEDPACTQTYDCADAAVPCFPGVDNPTSFAPATASSDLVPVTTGSFSTPSGLVVCHAGSFMPGDDPRCTQPYTCPDDGITCFIGVDSGVMATMSDPPAGLTDAVGRATTTATTYVKQTRASPATSLPVFTGGAAAGVLADGQRGGRMAALAAAVAGVAAAVL